MHHGSITKTGNAHVRSLLVEAAWSYRRHSAIGINLRRRSEGQPPEVLAYAWVELVLKKANLATCCRNRSI